tara:strand:- start:9 stop:269 length:261 start_codon:yes stop_codon:yes gene_type:complete
MAVDRTEAHLVVERVVAVVQLALLEMRVAVAEVVCCPVLVVLEHLMVMVRVALVAPQVTLVEAVAEMQTAAVAVGEQMAERQHSHR